MLTKLINGGKFAWVCAWLAINTLMVTPPILISTIGSTTGNFAFTMSRVWAWLLLKATGVKVVVRNRDRIACGQPYIIISNHQSHFDGPALAVALGIQFRWIAKKELLRIPLFGRCLRMSRNIFIDRSNRESAIRSINAGIAALPPGVSVMCFAEGTRSAADRQVERLKKAASPQPSATDCRSCR
jgi:1-acyl-sn-glycerol-3-phosphate acyltransferase